MPFLSISRKILHTTVFIVYTSFFIWYTCDIASVSIRHRTCYIRFSRHLRFHKYLMALLYFRFSK
nr:MAG TPA: hypothetical protein [Caudoviricetes sp.]